MHPEQTVCRTWFCLEFKARLFSMAENADRIETVVFGNIEHICDVVAAQITSWRDASSNSRCLAIERHPTANQQKSHQSNV